MNAERHRLADEVEEVGGHPVGGASQIRIVEQVPEVARDLGAGCAELADGPERRLHRLACEVHGDALPHEERLPPVAEAGGPETIPERLRQEIDLDDAHVHARELPGMAGDD